MIDKIKIPGMIITLIQIVSSILFMGLLYQTKLIPNKFLIIIGIVFLLISLVVFLMTRDSRYKVRLILGLVLTVAILVILVYSGGYLIKGVNTLDEITETSVELANIGIYVKADDDVSQIADMVGYTFGIMEKLDRENTDKVIAEIEAMVGTDLSIRQYVGLAELMDSLFVTREIDAIIMNNAFLDMISEMEGYEGMAEQLREVHVQQIETVIEEAEDDVMANASEQIEDKDSSNDVFTVYISGIDSRSGLIAKSRSDVNILATVNTKTHQILLVSTPRDYYVPLSISNGFPDKLTHAGIYGIDVSIGTLEMLYETDIDYYFRVNFSGFEKIIDALDGITIVSDCTFDSQNVKGYSFVKGKNFVDGNTALAFARERYAFSDGDRQRGRNQMAVIQGVLEKAVSPTLLKNYSNIMESIVGSFETSVPYDVLAELVRNQLNAGAEWNIVSYGVDGTGDSKRPYSLSTNAYVMIPDYSTVNTAITMMNAVKEGKILE